MNTSIYIFYQIANTCHRVFYIIIYQYNLHCRLIQMISGIKIAGLENNRHLDFNIELNGGENHQ